MNLCLFSRLCDMLPPSCPTRPIRQSQWQHRPSTPTTLCRNMANTKPEVVCNSGMGRAIDAIPTATPTFSTTPNPPKSLATPSVNCYYLISTWRTPKPEVVCNSGTGRAIDAIPTATPTFSTTPNPPKSLATSSVNSYYPISTWRTLNRK